MKAFKLIWGATLAPGKDERCICIHSSYKDRGDQGRTMCRNCGGNFCAFSIQVADSTVDTPATDRWTRRGEKM
jgi:hypothetical protein